MSFEFLDPDNYCYRCSHWRPMGCKVRTCFKSANYDPNVTLQQESPPISIVYSVATHRSNSPRIVE